MKRTHMIKICDHCSERYCVHCSDAWGPVEDGASRFCSKECKKADKDKYYASGYSIERRNLATRPKVTIVLDERGEPVELKKRLLDTTYGDETILALNKPKGGQHES